MKSSTTIAGRELPHYDWPHSEARARVQRRLHLATYEVLGAQLASIGWSLGADPRDEGAAISKAKTGRGCHCGRHLGRTYPRCWFEEPLDAGEVIENAAKRGLDSAALLAALSGTLEHQADDVWLALGIGSGVDVLGIEDGRGTRIERLIGIDLSNVALGVARALHPQILTGRAIDDVSAPLTGRLFVLSSLVFNYVDVETARHWANFVAGLRSTFLWVDVAVHPDYRGEQGTRWAAEDRLRALGFRDERRPILENHRFTLESGYGDFVAEAVAWAL
jgi:hypothetical protein